MNSEEQIHEGSDPEGRSLVKRHVESDFQGNTQVSTCSQAADYTALEF